MKLTTSKMVGIIVGVMGITTGLISMGDNVYVYHKTLATNLSVDEKFLEAKKDSENKFLAAKKDSELRYVNLRLFDVEASIRYFQRIGIDKLDTDSRSDYDDLRESRKRLTHERNVVLGLTAP